MSDNRKFQREKRRISCEYRSDGESHSGLVSNLSARGLFIQSSLMPEDGTQLELILHDADEGEVQLWGRVVRKKLPHRTLSAVEPGGFGISIESASEDYFRLLASLGML